VIYQTISPDGKWVLMIAAVANQLNLYVYPLTNCQGSFVARQLTSTAGARAKRQFSPDSKEVYYSSRVTSNIIPLENRQTRQLAVTAEMDVDFAREKLRGVSAGMDLYSDNFFDPDCHGANWKPYAASTRPWRAGARSPDELRRIILEMLGELNASHSGISAPQSSAQPAAIGRLECDSIAKSTNARRLGITEVIR